MKTKLTTLLAMTLGLTAASGAVLAGQNFDQLDENGDGRISREEAGKDSMLAESFARVDRDGNGYVTPTEYAIAKDERTQEETAGQS